MGWGSGGVEVEGGLLPPRRTRCFLCLQKPKGTNPEKKFCLQPRDTNKRRISAPVFCFFPFFFFLFMSFVVLGISVRGRHVL